MFIETSRLIIRILAMQQTKTGISFDCIICLAPARCLAVCFAQGRGGRFGFSRLQIGAQDTALHGRQTSDAAGAFYFESLIEQARRPLPAGWNI